MKYQFIKVDEDTTKLKYKDKEYTFTKTVGLIEKLQSSVHVGKANMMKFLKSRGETAKDYVITRTEGSKIIEDKSNLVELEQQFQGEARAEVFDDICKEFTNQTFAELLVDIGINVYDLEELKDFTGNLSLAVSNYKKDEDTPSEIL